MTNFWLEFDGKFLQRRTLTIESDQKIVLYKKSGIESG